MAESHGDKATSAHTQANGREHAFPPFQKDTFASQLVSLAIAFVALYLIVSKIALPRERNWCPWPSRSSRSI